MYAQRLIEDRNCPHHHLGWLATENTMSITLYAAPMSSAIPVVQVLAELDVPHELVLLDLSAGEQRKPEYLALNPNGQVPTLVVDGTPMFEAVAIMQWLGDRYGVARGLWPATDDPLRLEALSWTTWTYVTFSSTFKRMFLATSDRVPKELHSEVYAKQSRAELQGLLSILDKRLASRDHMLGKDYTLVDLVVGSAVTYGTFCGLPIGDHPHVKRWLSRVHERPSFKRVWEQQDAAS